MKNLTSGESSNREGTPGGACFRTLAWQAAFLFVALSCAPMQSLAGGTVTSATETALRSAMASGGTVTFASNMTITVAAQLNVVTDTILDAGSHSVTISGGSRTRIFNVSSVLTLRGITVQSGKSQFGAGVFVQNQSTLNATNCTFASNAATGSNGVTGAVGASRSGTAGDGQPGGTGGDATGGAIFNNGTIFLQTCSFITNSAVAGNGGAGGAGGAGTGTLGVGGNGGEGGTGGVGHGGAIFNSEEGVATVENCTFTGNSASGGNGGAGGAGGTGTFAGGRQGQGGVAGPGFGGAIHNERALNLNACSFSLNSSDGGDTAAGGTLSNLNGARGYDGADGMGGALRTIWYASVENCTFFNNAARGGAGGNGGPGLGTLQVRGNGGSGGNAYGGSVQASNTASFKNCTILKSGAFGGTNGVMGTGNFGGEDGNRGSGLGGNIYSYTIGTRLFGNLIGWSTAGGAGRGVFTDGGYNIVDDSSMSLPLSQVAVTNLKLGTYGSHGGLTPTVSLLAGSPAVDRIPFELAPPVDQRGVDRPVGPRSDVGAYEWEGLPTAITGRVLDFTNGVPGVLITITDEEAGVVGVLITDAAGNFSSTALSPGTYEVTPSLTNYSFSPVSALLTVPHDTNVVFMASPVLRVSTVGASTNGTLQLSVGGISNLTYTIQTSTNLVDWENTTNLVAPFTFRVPMTNATKQFFRLDR